nr:hypothetical protein [Oceanimonas sp. MB9]
MKIAFRADASIQIGTGHVMRCLTLAEELRLQGHECLFICREHKGHLGDLIASKSFSLNLLPSGDEAEHASTELNWGLPSLKSTSHSIVMVAALTTASHWSPPSWLHCAGTVKPHGRRWEKWIMGESPVNKAM